MKAEDAIQQYIAYKATYRLCRKLSLGEYLVFLIYSIYAAFFKKEDSKKSISESPRIKQSDFIEYISLTDNVNLAIDHYEYCPELFAFIRVIKGNKQSMLYKRKVHIDNGKKYIKYEGNRLYLDVEKIEKYFND